MARTATFRFGLEVERKGMKPWQVILIVGVLFASPTYLRPSANAQQTFNFGVQQIKDEKFAECILEHHQVGSDSMAAYVIGACEFMAQR